ncbi:MAG: 30S ribosomal protein S3 [Ruminococcaceae bacterium]|nr:30S ribosomal protein S3 [Oscillospiraceae bacterium]
MGQKVNPHGLRVGVIKDWDSRWFAKDEVFGDTLVSDYNLRKYLKNSLKEAGVPKIEIERDNERVRVFIHCAKPGMIIGRGGSEIAKLKETLEAMVGKTVVVNVVEVKTPDLNAQLVAENIAGQLERRVAFRRAMKQSIGRTMRLGAKGIKISLSGRLAGAEIARTEHYHEGTIPLQTIRADIDYGFYEADTTYGKIGVKVWIYNGEVLADSQTRTRRNTADNNGDRRDNRRRGDRRDNRGEKREGGNFRNNNRGNGRGFNRDEKKEVRNFSNRKPGFSKPVKEAPVQEAPAVESTEGSNE